MVHGDGGYARPRDDEETSPHRLHRGRKGDAPPSREGAVRHPLVGSPHGSSRPSRPHRLQPLLGAVGLYRHEGGRPQGQPPGPSLLQRPAHQDPPRRPSRKAVDRLQRLPEGEDSLCHEELHVPHREGTGDREHPAGVHGAPPLRGLPLGRLRQAQKLLRLPGKYGKDRVEHACRRALSFDLIDVRRVEGMIVKGLEGHGRCVPGNGDRPGPVRETGLVLLGQGG